MHAGFTERTGAISLSITEGNYKIRRFLDDGSSAMSSTTGTSTGTVQFNYSAKPIFIQTILAPRQRGPRNQSGSTQKTGPEDLAMATSSANNQTYVFNSVGQLLYNKKVDDLVAFKKTLPAGLYIIWRNNKVEKYRALYYQ